MINAHQRNKDYYGGETMPEGTKDCSSCGWHGKEEQFKYGLCLSCAPDDEEEERYRRMRYDNEEEERYCRMNDDY